MEENFLNIPVEDNKIIEEQIKLETLLLKQKQREEKRAIKMAAAFIGLAYFLQLAVPYLFSFVLIFGGMLTGLTNEINKLLADSAFLMVMQIVLSVLAFIFPYMIISAGVGRKITKLVCFSRPEKGTFLPTVLMGLGFCVFGNFVSNIISMLFSTVGIKFSSPDFVYPEGFFGSILAILAVGITPALVEEFAMRGMIMGALRPFGKGFAIMTSAFIFGMMHCNFVQFPFAFTVGLALGFAVVKSGSIWTAVVIHLLNNTLSVCLDLLFEDIKGETLQTVILLGYFSICILCFFVGLFLASHKTDFWKREKTEISLSVGEIAGCFFLSPVILIDIIISLVCCMEYVKL